MAWSKWTPEERARRLAYLRARRHKFYRERNPGTAGLTKLRIVPKEPPVVAPHGPFGSDGAEGEDIN